MIVLTNSSSDKKNKFVIHLYLSDKTSHCIKWIGSAIKKRRHGKLSF